MPLQVLSLSVNGISSLRDFMHCRELRELYLRKNNVANLNDIRSASAAAAGRAAALHQRKILTSQMLDLQLMGSTARPARSFV